VAKWHADDRVYTTQGAVQCSGESKVAACMSTEATKTAFAIGDSTFVNKDARGYFRASINSPLRVTIAIGHSTFAS
jgi:hypothetical protein